MKYRLPEQVDMAIKHLLTVALAEGVLVAGFAFRGEPNSAMTNFGNCTDHSDIKLFEALCAKVQEKKALGMVLTEDVLPPV